MKATKKIVGATCALVAAVALSAGSTFAWFTSNNEVKANNISATVVTKGGDLQIGLVKYKTSTDGTETSLTSTSADTTGNVDTYSYTANLSDVFSSFKFDALTSTDGVTFYDQENSTATSKTASTAVNSADGGYIQFTLSFKSNTATDVYLGSGSSITSTASTSNPTSIVAWKEITSNEYGSTTSTFDTITSGSAITAKAENAARVSFGTGTISSTNTTKIWAPYETDDNGGDANTAEAGFCTGNLASDYAKSNNGDAKEYTNVAKTEYSAGNAEVANTLADNPSDFDSTVSSGTKIVTLNSDNEYTAEVTVRLWIEGRDGDCFNSIFDQTVTFLLDFYGVKAAS